MTALLLAHLVVGVTVVAAGQRLGRRGALVGLLAPVATLAWLATKLPDLLDGRAHVERVEWIPALELGFDLRVDGFSALMILLVSGIGSLVFVYASRYLPAGGPRVGRLTGLLVLFAGAMLGLVAADDLLVLYGFWELTSVTSFLLIGNDHENAQARGAALQAFLVTGAGGLAMLGGFLILGHSAGTYRLSEIVAAPPSGTAVSAALALILLGAFTKSAQYPFHSWLPGAMVAPTPVSAYLHSATMVKAGVYLVARLSPAFGDVIGWWRPIVVAVGLTTMVLAGLRALRQTDLKVLLAHGTVSQLGFLIATFGVGTDEAMVAGAALLLAHALFKAANFLVVGIVDHQFGTRDLRRLPRLDRSWLPVTGAVVVGAASMAGVPPLFGFVAKELVLDVALGLEGGAWPAATVAFVVGAVLTAGYSLRFAMGATGRLATDAVEVRPRDVRAHPSLVGPMLVLTATTVGIGIVPALADGLVEGAAGALTPLAEAVHLALWHGVNGALVASAIALAGGALLFVARRPVGRVLAAGHRVPDGTHAYLATLRGLNDLADRVTAVAQPGALPIYAGVILTTAAIVPLVGLSGGGAWPGWPSLVDTAAHVPFAVVILGAALASVIVRRRLSAAVFLGVVGYAMAGLFVIRGAPDLALTQVAMETLSTVLFVIVLRRLPDRFVSSEDATSHEPEMRLTRTRAIRIAISLAVFASVFVLAIVMSGPEPSTPASDEMVERSLPDGHGRNVVNVILVDFRGFDTLGRDSSCLASAVAIGTVALAWARSTGPGAPLGHAGRPRPRCAATAEARAARGARRVGPHHLRRGAGRVDLPALRRAQPTRRRVRRRHRRRRGRLVALSGGRHRRGPIAVAGSPVDGARHRPAPFHRHRDRAAAGRRPGPVERLPLRRRAGDRVGQPHVGAGVRHRRLPRRGRPGPDDVRVLRRRPDRATEEPLDDLDGPGGPTELARPAGGGDAERPPRLHRRQPVRHRHLPRAPAQAVAGHHRHRPYRPRRQRPLHHLRSPRPGPADRVGTVVGVRRPAPPGPRPHRHRHHLRRHRAPPRARLPELAAERRRRDRGRRRGPPRRRARPVPSRRGGRRRRRPRRPDGRRRRPDGRPIGGRPVNDLLAVPVVLPLLGAAVSILVGRSRYAQRVVAIGVLAVMVVVSIGILIHVDREGVTATQAGGWAAPMGISLVADRLSAMMLVVASSMLLIVLIYAIGQPGAERNHVGFQSVYLVMAAGVSAAFLTADLFNLFVAIEMMLTASYVLITLGGRLEQVRAGMTYVVISLIASMLFLAALAYTYAATGTVSLAGLAEVVPDLPTGTRTALAALLLVVFALKAALLPLYFWLPDSYPTAPSPVTAIFAGLLTKVGIYAIIRTQTLIFPGDLPPALFYGVAAATMVVGVLGAIAQDDVKRILSFNIIGQIGYMVAGIGLFDLAGLAAVIISLVHHIVVKTSLFLAGGLIEHRGGSSRLDRLGGMVATAPAIAILFAVPALALAGIPPLSGFVSKFSLLAALSASEQWWILGVGLVVGLLTLFSMVKIWIGVFWAPSTVGAGATVAAASGRPRPGPARRS